MKLSSEQDVENTQEKIRLLEAHYERVRAKQSDPELNAAARRLVLSSLQRTINEMKEDVVRYRSASSARQRVTN